MLFWNLPPRDVDEACMYLSVINKYDILNEFEEEIQLLFRSNPVSNTTLSITNLMYNNQGDPIGYQCDYGQYQLSQVSDKFDISTEEKQKKLDEQSDERRVDNFTFRR